MAKVLPSVQLYEQVRAMGFHDATITLKGKPKDAGKFVFTVMILTEVIGAGKGTNKTIAQYNAYDDALKHNNNKDIGRK